MCRSKAEKYFYQVSSALQYGTFYLSEVFIMGFLLKVKEFFKKAWTAVKAAYQTKKWLSIVSAIVGVAVVSTAIVLPIALNGKDDASSSSSSTPTESSSSSGVSDSSSNDPEHEHVFVDMVTEATCKEQGYTTYTCKCGESYVAEYVDKLPHTPVVDEAVEPTCTKTGLTEGSHCDVCGDTIVAQETVKANGHAWGGWRETKPATEVEKGEKRRDCDNCTAFETSPIAELSHSHSRYEEIILPAVAQNCTETGLTEGKKCSGCQEILVAQDVIPADGHTEIIDAAVPATCTETGLTEGKHCDVCEEVLIAQTTVNALDHDKEFHAKQAPTCTEIGWDDYYTCKRTNCDYSTYVEKPALDHNYVNNVCTRCFDEKASEGLRYTLSNDGTYYSVSKGTCTDMHVVIPSTYENKPVKEIEFNAFSNCDFLQSIVIPDSVQFLRGYAFSDCDSLQSVTIGNGVQSVAHSAFESCDVLQSAIIGNNVLSIGSNAFYGCQSLQSVAIGNSVQEIGEDAFSCCGMQSVTIPNSVESIGNRAFRACNSLQSVIIGNSVQSIGEHAFVACSIQSVIIPDSVQSIGKGAFSNCTDLTSIEVSTGNATYQSIDGNLYTKDGKTLVQYALGKAAISFTVPDGVQSVGNWAFAFCESLQNLTTGNSVETIGDWAFYDCESLQSVIIGSGVQSIGKFAFAQCSSLQRVIIGNNVQSIERSAFDLCPLSEVTFENKNGWYVTKTESATSGTDISATDLEDEGTAAMYFKDTYYDYYYWYRKD